MTFKQWLYGTGLNNPSIEGQWKTLHIVTLVICILLIVGLSFLFKNKSEKARRNLLLIISAILIFFEVTRRIVNITNPVTFEKYNLLWVLLPRPGCAISVWLVMFAPIINKKWFYNISSMISILCAIVFFAYPGAGFLNKYIIFENLYSIVTHSLFFVGCFLIVTLRLADFNYKKISKESIFLLGIVLYSLLEMFVLTKNTKGDPLEADPFYVLANNEIQEMIGISSHSLYMILYFSFIFVYFSAFYLVKSLSDKKHKKVAYKEI